jgi:hypothetical protein
MLANMAHQKETGTFPRLPRGGDCHDVTEKLKDMLANATVERCCDSDRHAWVELIADGTRWIIDPTFRQHRYPNFTLGIPGIRFVTFPETDVSFPVLLVPARELASSLDVCFGIVARLVSLRAELDISASMF